MRSRFHFVVLVSLFFCGSAFAQVDYHPKVRTVTEMFAEQRRVIGSWCKFDFDGARLAKDGWARMAPLTTLKSNPEFSSFYVISRYEIERPEVPSNSLEVAYYQIGEFRPESGFAPGTHVEIVKFEMTEREGDLLIREFSPLQPRVSRQAAIAWLKHQAEVAASDVEKFPFLQALKLLAPAATTPAPSN